MAAPTRVLGFSVDGSSAYLEASTRGSGRSALHQVDSRTLELQRLLAVDDNRDLAAEAVAGASCGVVGFEPLGDRALHMARPSFRTGGGGARCKAARAHPRDPVLDGGLLAVRRGRPRWRVGADLVPTTIAERARRDVSVQKDRCSKADWPRRARWNTRRARRSKDPIGPYARPPRRTAVRCRWWFVPGGRTARANRGLRSVGRVPGQPGLRRASSPRRGARQATARTIGAKDSPNWGAKLQQDLADGVAALSASGVVDPRRVCYAGRAKGGYMALAGQRRRRLAGTMRRDFRVRGRERRRIGPDLGPAGTCSNYWRWTSWLDSPTFWVEEDALRVAGGDPSQRRPEMEEHRTLAPVGTRTIRESRF